MSSEKTNILAFALNKTTLEALHAINLELAGSLQCQLGDINKATQTLIEQGAPDILIVDGGQCLQLESALLALSEYCPPQMKLIVLGEKTDLSLYRNLLFAGVSDYHTTPLDQDVLRLSILHLQGKKLNKVLRQGRTICVIGCAGGTGASTVASNLAWIMGQEQKQRVALLDFDLFHSQHPILLGMDYEPSLNNLLNNAQRIDATLLMHSAQQVSPNLHLFYDQNSHLSFEHIEQPELCVKAMAEHYGTVILDIPDLRHPALLKMLDQADICIWINDASLSGFRYIDKLRHRFSNQEQRNLLVYNASRQAKARIPKAEIERAATIKICCELPFDDKAFLNAESQGTPLVKGKSKLAKQLRSLALQVSNVQEG
ncbi:AAA family ATPase [Psychromonas sp. Urea-02u-13]|uniref:AAA family ATPase n=1 Tax=Psychromonas sp. Urea-02u-13 TaxID=2058326 RepID=UPI000C33D657|nr:P-loop NTPase [Psychromonas sp. Urea-02u-13]PKG40163.1 pilus assembly protein CpaE [Psychromonas sp. Urea-02u-13]